MSVTQVPGAPGQQVWSHSKQPFEEDEPHNLRHQASRNLRKPIDHHSPHAPPPPNAHRSSPRVQTLYVDNKEQPELVAVCEERGIMR